MGKEDERRKVVTLLIFILIIISIPSFPHSFVPGLNLPFFCKSYPPQPSFSSSRLTPRIPGLFTDTSEHIRFVLFSFFSVFPF